MVALARREWRRLVMGRVGVENHYLNNVAATATVGPPAVVTIAQFVDRFERDYWVRGELRCLSGGTVVTRQITASDVDGSGQLTLTLNGTLPNATITEVDVLRAPMRFDTIDECLKRVIYSADATFMLQATDQSIVMQPAHYEYPLPDGVNLITRVGADVSQWSGDRVVGLTDKNLALRTMTRLGSIRGVAQRVQATSPVSISKALIPLMRRGTPTTLDTITVAFYTTTESAADERTPTGRTLDLPGALLEAAAFTATFPMSDIATNIRWLVADFGSYLPYLADDVGYMLVVLPTWDPAGDPTLAISWPYNPTKSYPYPDQDHYVCTYNGSVWSPAAHTLPATGGVDLWTINTALQGPQYFRLITDQPEYLYLERGRREYDAEDGSPGSLLLSKRVEVVDGRLIKLEYLHSRTQFAADGDTADVDAEWFINAAAADLILTAAFHDRLKTTQLQTFVSIAQNTARQRRLMLDGILVRMP